MTRDRTRGDGDDRIVVTINAGSSSVKYGAVLVSAPANDFARGALPLGAPEETVRAVLERSGAARREVVAMAHRFVHGGALGDRARRLTPDLVARLRDLAPLDPDHLPASLAIAEAAMSSAPRAVHVACFDTAFHSTMPPVAKRVAIPRKYAVRGVQRYGFHGLSYTFVVEEIARVAGEAAAKGRLVLAHLGSGSSLAAVLGGESVDTTMGFTPASGVCMSTRSGDLDPGVATWLLREEGWSWRELDHLVNKEAGLLGVSETTGDMRELLAREDTDPRARDAVQLFCHQVRKSVGALATTIGGLDMLVFSGGIGENSPVVRERVARGLEHLGVALDPDRNARGEGVISARDSRAAVRVVRTDEESILARQALEILHQGP